jgi:NTP pyrophosphatase (non-canonical NTP hydrolase)
MTDEQQEILTILSEECAEVIQAVSKMIRFGVDSINPYTGDVNKARLEDELTDVIAIVGILGTLDVVDKDRIFAQGS